MNMMLMNMMLKKIPLKEHVSLCGYVLDNGLNRLQFGTVQAATMNSKSVIHFPSLQNSNANDSFYLQI
jgi:hypothetical protein